METNTGKSIFPGNSFAPNSKGEHLNFEGFVICLVLCLLGEAEPTPASSFSATIGVGEPVMKGHYGTPASRPG